MTTGINARSVSQTPITWQASVDHAKRSDTLWRRFTELFTPKTASIEQVFSTSDAFKDHFRAEVARLSQSIPDAQVDAFLARAETMMEKIVGDSLAPSLLEATEGGTGELRERTLNASIRTAHGQAEKALKVLTALARIQSHQASADICPEVIAKPPRADGSPGGFTLIRKAPQIENLVLKGGGGKGLGNPPALIELERAGVLTGLKQLVGTSAGALTAALLSSGISPQAFQDISHQTNMGDKAGEPLDTLKYPGIQLGFGFKEAGGILAMVDQKSAESVSKYLGAQWESPSFKAKLALMSEGEQVRLQALRQQNFDTDRTSQMITFRDLSLLHRLEPTQFKELTLTGFNNTDKTLHYFNAKDTPDMPIAIAGRISMSIPAFFQSVKYDIGDGEGLREWTDGGVGSNMPAGTLFEKLEGQVLEEKRARTMLMTFDEDGRAHEIMHGREAERQKGATLKEKLLGGNPNINAARLDDAKQVYDAGPNAFVVFHGDLSTFSLSPSKAKLENAEHQSTMKTLEFIEQRLDQAYAVDVSSLDDAVLLMSDQERQLFLDRHG